MTNNVCSINIKEDFGKANEHLKRLFEHREELLNELDDALIEYEGLVDWIVESSIGDELPPYDPVYFLELMKKLIGDIGKNKEQIIKMEDVIVEIVERDAREG